MAFTADGLTAAHQGQCAGRRLRGHGREGAVETTAHKTDLGSIVKCISGVPLGNSKMSM